MDNKSNLRKPIAIDVTRDGTSKHIAVVDKTGQIVAVNKAWRQFVLENDIHAYHVLEGINYLDVCDQSASDGDEYAKKFAVGLRAVIANQIKSFSMEYPYHTPHEKRWFNGHVERITKNDTEILVISHRNITGKKLLETEFRHSEQLNRLILSSISDAVFLTDDRGDLTFVCPNVSTIFGYSYEEAIAYGNIKHILGDLPVKPGDLSEKDEIQNIEHHIVDKFGELHMLLINIKQVNIDQGTVLYTCRDVTEYQQIQKRLRESEERYLALFERSQDAVYLHDFDGNFIDANPATLEMLGYSQQEIANINFCDLLSPDQQSKALLLLENIKRTGFQQDFTGFVLHTKTNQTIHVETMSSVLYREGQAWAVQGVARDVTKQVLEHVAEHEQRLVAEALHKTSATLLSNTLNIDDILHRMLEDIFNIIRSDTVTVMLVDSGVATIVHCTGFEDDEVGTIKNVRFDIEATRNLREMAESKKPLLIVDTFEYEGWDFNVPQDSLLRSCIGTPICIEEQLIGFLIVNSYIPNAFTETHLHHLQLFADHSALAINNAQLYEDLRNYNKKLEQTVEERTLALEQERDRLQTVLDNTADAIVIINRYGVIQQSNPTFKQVFEAASMEDGSNFSDIIAVDQQDRFNTILQSVMKSSKPQRIELQINVFDQPFSADIVLSCVRFGNTREAEIICSLRDITALKESETQLRLALEQERELNEIKTAFTSMISHEFRTPLAVINSSSDILLHYYDRLSPEKREVKLNNIVKQVGRLTELMNQVLIVSQADMKGLPFNPEPTDLIDLCDSIVEDVQVYHEKNIKIDFVCHALGGKYVLDENLFRHIFQNLLSNSVKYSHERATVSARIHASSDHLTLVVADSGIGIPKENQGDLFNTFHRAGNVGTIQGTGLGLAIVKRAVNAHGGSIQFNSVENEGTLFCVTLPIARVE